MVMADKPLSAPRLSWNQPTCERCWIDQNKRHDGDGVFSIRQPVRFVDPDNPRIEFCAWCGLPTIVGIFQRADPATVRFPARTEGGE